MVDPKALSEVADEEIEAALPRRPVTSLRDIEVLYGELYALATAGGGAYAKYLSPDEARDLVGGENLLTVYVDLTGETPTLRENKPADQELYTEALVPRVAHAKFEAARGVDHSLTHQSGQDNAPEKLATHATDRFTRWATEDAVKETAAQHEDGWIINALAMLGEDENAIERIVESVRERVPESKQMLVTVALKADSDTLTTTDAFDPQAEWHYPGEFEVLQEAMAARKTAKFKAKNEAKAAVGDGRCYVQDTDERVFGVVDDPLKCYLSKQMEKFPRLDPDESWRTQGLSRDAAIAAQNATTFLDACQFSTLGVSIYYLPYLCDRMCTDDAKALYEILAAQTSRSDDETVTTIERVYDRHVAQDGSLDDDRELDRRLRFYVLVFEKYQKDRWRLLENTGNASMVASVELAQAHQRALEEGPFGEGRVFPFRENFRLIDPPQGIEGYIRRVASPEYFWATCARRDADSDPDRDPDSDDFRFRATANVLAGLPVSVDELLAEYVTRIINEFDPASEYPFPTVTVVSQYAQLRALANVHVDNREDDAKSDDEESDDPKRVGLLSGDPTLTTPPTPMANANTAAMSRTERLEQFIENHPALTPDTDDEDETALTIRERRGVFMLGALVGRISRYQRSEGRGMTAVTQHPIDGLTTNNIKRVATEVIDRNCVYSQEEGYTGTMYAELMDGVVDGLLVRDPDEWTLSTDDLRFHYALGVAYGLNDRSTSEYEESGETETDDTLTETDE